MSGIRVVFRQSDPALIRRHLRQAAITFGPERCMFGSNCPPDTVFHEFGDLLQTYFEALSELSPQAQHELFHGTARRVYRL